MKMYPVWPKSHLIYEKVQSYALRYVSNHRNVKDFVWKEDDIFESDQAVVLLYLKFKIKPFIF